MRSLFLFFVACAPVYGTDLSLMARYRVESTAPNTFDTIAGVSGPLLSWLDGEFAGRLALSLRDVEGLDYKGELRAHPFSFWEIALRVFQSNQLGYGVGVSQWLASTTLTAWPLPFLGAYATIGWHQRYLILSSNVGLPIFINHSYIDKNVAARLGFYVRPSDRWLVQFGISTIEDFDTFNLNSVFAHVSLEHRPAGSAWTLTMYSRYRLLLGFGRRDEFVLGFGARVPLGG